MLDLELEFSLKAVRLSIRVIQSSDCFGFSFHGYTSKVHAGFPKS